MQTHFNLRYCSWKRHVWDVIEQQVAVRLKSRNVQNIISNYSSSIKIAPKIWKTKLKNKNAPK